MKKRTAVIERRTKETDIKLTLNLDGAGAAKIRTGLPFFNHMLELLAHHASFDLQLKARGDLAVDYHHTVEDLGLALGTALNQALGDRRGINRYGWSYVPMDDALSRAVIDLGGRPYLVYNVAHRQKRILAFEVALFEEFFQGFCVQGRLNLHAAQLYGKDVHHAYESLFKAVARALRMACAPDPRRRGVPSSKGQI